MTEVAKLILNLGKKPAIPWRTPCCGGVEVHGTDKCHEEKSDGKWICFCAKNPINFNYLLHYLLINEIKEKGLHMLTRGEMGKA